MLIDHRSAPGNLIMRANLNELLAVRMHRQPSMTSSDLPYLITSVLSDSSEYLARGFASKTSPITVTSIMRYGPVF